jgi:hypothetical protein
MSKLYVPFFYLFFLFSQLLSQEVSAQQTTTNNWINYNQKYFKFDIITEGIYRINPILLSNAGIDLNTIHPKNFQIFLHGKEIPIYVENENDTDGVFNNLDFIEFYGNKNSGSEDSLIYLNPADQPNPEYSLFNDTATYFLTWNSSLNNVRISEDNDTNYSQYNNANYFLKRIYLNSNMVYNPGFPNSAGTYDPEYSAGESFVFITKFSPTTPFSIPHGTGNVYNGPQAYYTVHYVSLTDDASSTADNRLLTNIGPAATATTIGDTTWNGRKLLKLSYQFPSNLLQSPTTTIANRSFNLATSNAKTGYVSYSELLYPHNLDLEAKNSYPLILEYTSSQTKSRYQFTNINQGSSGVVFYDNTSGVRSIATATGTNYQVLTPNNTIRRNCFISSIAAIANITTIKAAGTNGTFTKYENSSNANFLIVTHKKLMSSANNYANYRNSKGYQTLVADIDELYDQFAYGIKKNPISIRKFAEFATLNFDSVPKYLLIIGKGIVPSLAKKDTSNYRLCLVPTWGYNASDNILTCRLPGAIGYAPRIPIGRIAANNTQQVDDYLTKLQQYESAPKAMWMKNVLHFAGGTSLGEQNQFAYLLDQYKNMYLDTLFGGRVTTFKKTSADPIQIAQADSIRQLIENGVSFMNFFGHAAGSSFDVSPEPPATYNNTARYPIIMANSCNVGDIHQPPSATYQFVSEEYVLIPQKGSIGFLAQSSLGLANPNGIYSKALVKNITSEMYGKSIGECINDAIKTVQQPNDELLKETCLTMTYHGDPSIIPNFSEKPDYSVSQNSVSLSPSIVSTELDSFNVDIIIKNEGRAIQKNIIVQVKRLLPDSTNPRVYIKTIAAPKYIDTVSIKLPVLGDKSGGTNNLEIFVDALNNVDEMNESNNIINYSFDIISKDIIPIYPYDYSIIPTQRTALKASTLDAFAPMRTYRFQIDTTDKFNSAFKKDTTITQIGGVLVWPLAFNLSDSTVYYWRVSAEPSASSGYKWRESSFQYIQDKRGWGQSHFYQFKNNQFNLLQYNKPNRSFDYGNITKTLTAKTYTALTGQIPSDNNLFATEYRIGTELQESAGNSYNAALHVAIIDSATLKPWEIYYVQNGVTYNPTNNFGNSNNNQAGQNHLKYFIFRPTVAAQIQGLKNMLVNAVPNGNYILIYTWIRGNFQSWADTSLYSVIEGLGSDSVRHLPNNRGWIFFCKKGHPNTAQEVNTSSDGAFELNLAADMNTIITQGDIVSTTVGPSQRWDSLFWRNSSLENSITDSIRLSVIGIKNNGSSDTLSTQNIMKGSINLSNINASIYPFIKLNIHSEDAINLSAPQLKKWQILYEPVPECALNSNNGSVINKKEVQQGEAISFKMPVLNVSDADMDSLLISYWLEKPDKTKIPLSFPRKDSLRRQEIMFPEIKVDTRTLLGDYKLFMEANPFVESLQKYDQAEQYHFNNKTAVSFKVTADKLNPLLDVTFDGYHIMDGDIVSAKPSIHIELKDENKYLALNDTSSFRVFLTEPNSTNAKRIYFINNGAEQMRFNKAVLPNNKASIDYLPELAIDGTYKLTVQAIDASNNKSGSNDFAVNFEIVHQSTITEVMNYPNPFTTSTRFVFTLTGSELPTWFKIQILSVSGKVVREITQQELGAIRIGKNISEYAWDGTDEYGDPLGNGVYFYKVFTRINDKEIAHRASGADAYFKHEFGKMYLMR